jgi:hypothetical protein
MEYSSVVVRVIGSSRLGEKPVGGCKYTGVYVCPAEGCDYFDDEAAWR